MNATATATAQSSTPATAPKANTKLAAELRRQVRELEAAPGLNCTRNGALLLLAYLRIVGDEPLLEGRTEGQPPRTIVEYAAHWFRDRVWVWASANQGNVVGMQKALFMNNMKVVESDKLQFGMAEIASLIAGS